MRSATLKAKGVVALRAGLRVGPLWFEVASGQVRGLVGESGAGKTTFARLLAGLDRPHRGEVWLNDAPRGRSARRPPSWRRVQYLPQDPAATLDPRLRIREAVEEAAQAVGNDADILELFDAVGLERTLRDRRPDQLSGGQRQRAGWARLLAADPDLLILDEPTTALDPRRARALEALIRDRAAAGVGVVIVSHDLDAVFRWVDDVTVFWRGRIVERGPAEQLLAKPKHPYSARLLHAGRAVPSAPGSD